MQIFTIRFISNNKASITTILPKICSYKIYPKISITINTFIKDINTYSIRTIYIQTINDITGLIIKVKIPRTLKIYNPNHPTTRHNFHARRWNTIYIIITTMLTICSSIYKTARRQFSQINNIRKTNKSTTKSKK